MPWAGVPEAPVSFFARLFGRRRSGVAKPAGAVHSPDRFADAPASGFGGDRAPALVRADAPGDTASPSTGERSASDAGTDPAQAPGEALPAETLLARLRDHALGPVPTGADALQDAHREVRMRVAASISTLDTQPERIPRRPQLLPALMRAIGSGTASAAAIATLVQQDPTLTGNVLRVANSAYYRVSGKPLDSVERAIARLGTDGMRPIIAATLLQPVMHAQRGAFPGFAPIAWEHSLIAATAAAEYARDRDRELGLTAHMVALLRGLGGIVVVQAVRDEYARRPLLVPDPRVAATLLDEAGPVAARIAAAWELPTPLLHALSVPAQAGGGGGGIDALGQALWLGRIAAAAVLLVRAGQLAVADARASMVALDPSCRAAAVVDRLIEPEPVRA